MKLQSILLLLLSIAAAISAMVMAFTEEYRLLAMISIILSFTSLELYVESKTPKK